jgi:hypothetical protein
VPGTSARRQNQRRRSSCNSCGILPSRDKSCSTSWMRWMRRRIGGQLELVKKLASLGICLFITSRPLPSVESSVPGVHSFPIASQGHDIDLHINRAISKSSDLQILLRAAGPALSRPKRRDCNLDQGQVRWHVGGIHPCSVLMSFQVLACFASTGGAMRMSYLGRSQTDTQNISLGHPGCLSSNAGQYHKAEPHSHLTCKVCPSLGPLCDAINELQGAVATSPETYKFELDEVVPGMSLVALCGLVIFEAETAWSDLFVSLFLSSDLSPNSQWSRLHGGRNTETAPI